jgi:hypothetical protein
MRYDHPCLEGDPWPFLDDRGVELVARYFDPASVFSGGQFERFCERGDAPEYKDRFTPADLLSVTLLDVTVPGLATIAILGDLAGHLSEHLGAIPTDMDLWDAPLRCIEKGSEVDRLWWDLVRLDGVASVIAAKLIARKRPRLIPVYDSVLKKALSPTDKEFWLALRTELGHSALRRRLAEMRTLSGVADDISLLRILDASVWMRNRRSSRHKLSFSPCPRHPLFC